MPDPPTSSFRPLPPRMYSCSRSLSDGLVSPRCVVIGPPRSRLGFRTLSDFQSSSAGHLLRRRRHGDLEHTVCEARLRLVHHDTLGQRNRAIEAAVTALGAIEAAAFGFLLVPAFTLDGDPIFPNVHLDIILLQTGQVGSHDKLVIAVVHLNIGCPRADAGTGEW